MQYFTKEYNEFFKDLEKNNRKEWFHANKKRYENHVRKPMIALVSDLIEVMNKEDGGFNTDAKKCLGRINRDIRFAKDKTPYNQHLFAHITKGNIDSPKPGIAFRFGAHDAGIMGGFYKLNKARLFEIRNKIQRGMAKFQEIKNGKDFVDKFDKLQGEAYKRVPPELKDTFEVEPLIANKQFYYVAEKKGDFVHSENLLEEILAYWRAAKPMNDFLT